MIGSPVLDAVDNAVFRKALRRSASMCKRGEGSELVEAGRRRQTPAHLGSDCREVVRRRAPVHAGARASGAQPEAVAAVQAAGSGI